MLEDNHDDSFYVYADPMFMEDNISYRSDYYDDGTFDINDYADMFREIERLQYRNRSIVKKVLDSFVVFRGICIG